MTCQTTQSSLFPQCTEHRELDEAECMETSEPHTHWGVSGHIRHAHTHSKSSALWILATGQIIGKQSLFQALCALNAIGAHAGCKRSWG